MQKRHFGLFVFLSAMACGAVAQDAITPATLKEKGAKVLSKGEVEALLPGSTVEQETDQYTIRQSNRAGGDLDVNGVTRFGGSANSPPWSAVGTWSVSDRGQYCIDYKTRSGGGTKNCAYLWAIGNDYFMTYGAAADAKGRSIKLSK